MKCRPASRVLTYAARTLRSKLASHAFVGRSRSGPMRVPPRVVHQDVDTPQLVDGALHEVDHLLLDLDVGRNREASARGASSTSDAVRCRSSTVRAAITTSAPWAAKSRAVAAPMPVPPPVTIATRFSTDSRSFTASSLHGVASRRSAGVGVLGDAERRERAVATYVLVHGGGHGGWCYRRWRGSCGRAVTRCTRRP